MIISLFSLIECQVNCECVWNSKPFCSSSKLLAHYYYILQNFKPHLKNYFEMVLCLCANIFWLSKFSKKPFRNMPIFSIYSGMDSPKWWKIFTPAIRPALTRLRRISCAAQHRPSMPFSFNLWFHGKYIWNPWIILVHPA